MKTGNKFHFWELVLADIRYRVFQYAMVFFIVFAGCFALSAGTALSGSMRQGAASLKERVGADIIIVPKGYGEISENALLEGEPCTLTMRSGYADAVRGLPGVTEVSTRLYFSTLEGASCCAGKTQLIVADLEHDFLLKSMMENVNIDLGKNECLVGSGYLMRPGDKIMYYGRMLLTKGVLPETGTGYDNSCFISRETAIDIMNNPNYAGMFKDFNEDSVSMIFLNTENTEQTLKDLENMFGQGSGIEWFSFHGHLDAVDQSVDGMTWAIRFFEIVLSIVCALSLFCLFSVFTAGREHEAGGLLILGLPYRKIFGILFAENAAVIAAASLLSTAAYYLLITQFKPALELALHVPLLAPGPAGAVVSFLGLTAFFLGIMFAAMGLVFFDMARRPAAELVKAGD